MHTQVAIKVNAVKNEYTATWEMWKPIGIYSLTFVSACFSHSENKIWDNFAFGEFWVNMHKKGHVNEYSFCQIDSKFNESMYKIWKIFVNCFKILVG